MRAQLTLALLLSISVGSARAEADQKTTSKDVVIPPFEVSDVYDAKVASAILSKWVKGDRKLASNQIFSEAQLSPQFKEIRTKFLAAKTAEDIDGLLVELESNYDKLSDDAKFFAAQMVILKPFRGIVWRLRPLFEQKSGGLTFLSGNPATHSTAVTALRLLSHATDVYVPTHQADALLNFVIAPNKQMRLAQQFKSVSEFQAFLLKEVYPQNLNAAKRISDLFQKSSKMPFVWDNQMMYGTASFQDGIRRYVGFGEAEVAATEAAILKSLHSILVFSAYNQDQLMNVAGKLGKLYGTDGYTSNDLGVTSAERAQVLNSFRSSGFLALRNPDYMKSAYKHLVASASYAVKAQEILQSQPANNGNLLNPLFFSADAQPRLRTGVANFYATLTKRTPVRNLVTGETIEVDVPAFYNDPPKSLLDMLPVSWKKGQSHEITFKNDAGESITYRDYTEGSPTGWHADAWKVLFPKLKSGAEVDDSFRTLQYSGGPNLVLGPLRGFIF